MTEPSVPADLAAIERHLRARRGRREGREIRFLCPAHHDTRPSARWSPAKATWYCDVCQQGGGWRDLARRLGLDPPRPTLAAAAAPTTPTATPPAAALSGRRHVAAAHSYTDAAGHLLYQVLRLEPKAFACRRPAATGGWIWNLQTVERVLYRLPALRAAIARDELLYLVEGEKDADALAALGFTATTQAGGAGKWRPAYTAALRGARVVVIPDHDDPGHRHAEAILAALRPHAADLRRLDLPNLPPKGDTSDWLAARRAEGLTLDQISCRLLDLTLAAPNLLLSAQPALLPAPPSPGASEPHPADSAPLGDSAAARPSAETAERPSTSLTPPGPAGALGEPAPPEPAPRPTVHGARCLADVPPRPVDFLWKPYLPIGKLTLLDGDPGQGKSWLTAALAAAGSRGHALPGTGPCDPFSTLFLCEDEIDAILRPRLDALHADPAAIHARDTVNDGFLDLSTAADIAKLDDMVLAFQPRLLVIDPIQAFLGRTDFYRPNEVRAALAPLLRLAHRRRLALLVLRHITKARTARSLYAGQGSIDFAAAARSVLLAGATPDNPDLHALIHIKSNLTAPGPSLAYRLDPAFTWQGPIPLSADDLLAPAAPPEDLSAEDEARAFLRALLAGPDPLPARLVLAAARDAAIAPRTLRRAKTKERIRVLRRGFGPGSTWLWTLSDPAQSAVEPGPSLLAGTASLPANAADAHRRPTPPEPAHPNTWPPMDHLGHLWSRPAPTRAAGPAADTESPTTATPSTHPPAADAPPPAASAAPGSVPSDPAVPAAPDPHSLDPDAPGPDAADVIDLLLSPTEPTRRKDPLP